MEVLGLLIRSILCVYEISTIGPLGFDHGPRIKEIYIHEYASRPTISGQATRYECPLFAYHLLVYVNLRDGKTLMTMRTRRIGSGLRKKCVNGKEEVEFRHLGEEEVVSVVWCNDHKQNNNKRRSPRQVKLGYNTINDITIQHLREKKTNTLDILKTGFIRNGRATVLISISHQVIIIIIII